MKSLSTYFLSTLLFGAAAFQAHAMPPKPEKCPSAKSIVAQGLTNTDYDEGLYVAYNMSQYDTNTTWGFGIGDIQASSPAEALSIGYQSLSTVSGNPTPVAIPEEDMWVCFYSNNAGSLAVAFTPLPVANKLKRMVIARK